MVTTTHIFEVFKPFAAELVALDAGAIAQLSADRKSFSGLDHQPASAAMAIKRRAIFATGLRKAATEWGWDQRMEKYACGAYEWDHEDLVIRLKKTVLESRPAASDFSGVQGSFWEYSPPAERDLVQIRLMGNALKRPSIEIAPILSDGRHRGSISLRAIAASTIESIGQAAERSAPRVSLPKKRDTKIG